MVLPSFLVIGAMKAGTTTLRDQLARHPDVFMSEPKELHFFTAGKNWERGRDWYEAHFAAGSGAAARGEASPSYSQADIFPGVPARIAAMLPDVRLVYLVRHPVERLRSMYLHQRANGRERRPIAEAVTATAYYLNTSRYAWQLDQYASDVARERIRVITTDQLRDDPAATMAGLFGFLGVDPAGVAIDDLRRGRTEEKRVARSGRGRLAAVPGYERVAALAPTGVRRRVRRVLTRPVDPAMAELPPALEAELVEQLRPDLLRLRTYLGDDFGAWGLLDDGR
jgi:Sulfotransferase domain